MAQGRLPLVGVVSATLVFALVFGMRLAKPDSMLARQGTHVPMTGLAEPVQANLNNFDAVIENHAVRAFTEGRQIFRFDTFGSEAFWGGQLRLHRAIAGARLGGVGPGVSPAQALALGLKVDITAVPPELVAAAQRGQVDVNDPALTVALLKANAIVGLRTFQDANVASGRWASNVPSVTPP